MVRAIVGGVDHDGVVGKLKVVDALEQLAHVAVMFEHTVGIFIARHAALAFHRVADMGERMHACGIHPDEEWFVSFGLFLNEVDGGLGGLVIDGFHALAVQCARIFDLAIGVTVDHPTR
ncbi:hypothetical protein D3C76_1303500 [compost metagenome]